MINKDLEDKNFSHKGEVEEYIEEKIKPYLKFSGSINPESVKIEDIENLRSEIIAEKKLFYQERYRYEEGKKNIDSARKMKKSIFHDFLDQKDPTPAHILDVKNYIQYLSNSYAKDIMKAKTKSSMHGIVVRRLTKILNKLEKLCPHLRTVSTKAIVDRVEIKSFGMKTSSRKYIILTTPEKGLTKLANKWKVSVEELKSKKTNLVNFAKSIRVELAPLLIKMLNEEKEKYDVDKAEIVWLKEGDNSKPYILIQFIDESVVLFKLIAPFTIKLQFNLIKLNPLNIYGVNYCEDQNNYETLIHCIEIINQRLKKIMNDFTYKDLGIFENYSLEGFFNLNISDFYFEYIEVHRNIIFRDMRALRMFMEILGRIKKTNLFNFQNINNETFNFEFFTNKLSKNTIYDKRREVLEKENIDIKKAVARVEVKPNKANIQSYFGGTSAQNLGFYDPYSSSVDCDRKSKEEIFQSTLSKFFDDNNVLNLMFDFIEVLKDENKIKIESENSPTSKELLEILTCPRSKKELSNLFLVSENTIRKRLEQLKELKLVNYVAATRKYHLTERGILFSDEFDFISGLFYISKLFHINPKEDEKSGHYISNRINSRMPFYILLEIEKLVKEVTGKGGEDT